MSLAIRAYFGSVIRALIYEWEVFKHDPFIYEHSFDAMILDMVLDKDGDM